MNAQAGASQSRESLSKLLENRFAGMDANHDGSVDKGEAGNLVSFCADGVRKIGPTQFEVRHTNFTPTRDLSVLILQGVRYDQ